MLAVGVALGLAAVIQKLEPAALTYLQCDLDTLATAEQLKNGQHSTIKVVTGFGFAASPPRVVDIYSPRATLTNLSVSDNLVLFSSAYPFHAYGLYGQLIPGAPMTDASKFSGEINRLTGHIEIVFYKRYGAAEIAACNKSSTGPWCNYPPVSATATGQCQEVNRRF
jgi:hypothetical protein